VKLLLHGLHPHILDARFLITRWIKIKNNSMLALLVFITYWITFGEPPHEGKLGVDFEL